MSHTGDDDYPMEEKYPLTEEEPQENASEKKEETVVMVQTREGEDTSVPCYYIVALVLSLLACFCVPFCGVIAIIFSSLGIEEKRDRGHSDQVRCGHRCKAICGLVTASFIIVLVIVMACLGAAFYATIFKFISQDLWSMILKEAESVGGEGSANQTTPSSF